MAKGQKRDKSDILTRTEKWELNLAPDTERLVIRISDSLREYFNWALARQQEANEAYKAALAAAPDAKPNAKRFLGEIDLYNLWKSVRTEDAAAKLFRAGVPANWVLETFKSETGAYKSFFTLVKHGDTDARPPRERPNWRFHAIPGCSAFSVKAGKVALAPEMFGKDVLSFPIPPTYQAKMLARNVRIAKFIIHRDEPDLRKPGRYWISVSYEIPKPEQKPFVPEEAVYVALGASSIGIVSPKGEETVELWRSDKHWKPEIDHVGAYLGILRDGETGKSLPALPRADQRPIMPGGKPDLRRPPLTKRSKQWRKMLGTSQAMNTVMARQQTQDRREVVAIDLIEKMIENVIRGHGVHFVVTELVVRSKEGKLADASQKGRGGPLGLNWSAQNTGSIGYLLRQLEAKAPEFGGSVRKCKLPYEALPKSLSKGHENKIPIARALKDHFLISRSQAA